MSKPLYFVRKETLHGFPVFLVVYCASDGDYVFLDFFKTANGAQAMCDRLNGNK